jgi:hypothetical protein
MTHKLHVAPIFPADECVFILAFPRTNPERAGATTFYTGGHCSSLIAANGHSTINQSQQTTICLAPYWKQRLI